MIRFTKHWFLAGIGAAALAPVVISGCQPNVQVASQNIQGDPYGAGKTAADAAREDAMQAIPSDRPTVRPGERYNGEDVWFGRVNKNVNCSSCHGAQGKGDGPRAGEFGGRIPDFTNFSYTRNKTPLSTYMLLSGGNRNQPHPFGDPRYAEQYLTDVQRWNVTYYVWSLHTNKETLTRGGVLFNENCSVCHGTKGRGDGFLAHPLNPAPRNFSVFEWMMDKPDNRLFRSIQHGRKWTAMPAWSQLPSNPKGITEVEIYEIVDYLRAFTYTYKEDIIVEASGH